MTEKIDILSPDGKKKTIIVEHNEYSSWLSKLFRKENWIRSIGIYVMYESRSFPESQIDILSWKFSSIVGLFVLGIGIAIGGPELMNIAIAKWGKKNKSNATGPYPNEEEEIDGSTDNSWQS